MDHYRKISIICYSLLALLLVTHYFFWKGIRFGSEEEGNLDVWWPGTSSRKPDLAIVPPLPTNQEIEVYSMGDKQFFFRLKAFDIQNAGDTFGRTTALKDYDYSKLFKWWKILDSLDIRSNFVPPLVSYYYGSSQEPERDLPYVVQYLEEHADTDPGKKWWWYSQAIYHAKHKLKDLDAAIRIANKLAAIPEDADAPLWARQMPAFIHEARGEYNDACKIILNIIDSADQLKEGELNFMDYFVRDRISAMVEAQKDPNAPPLDPRCQHIIDQLKKKEEAETAAAS